MKKVFGSVEGTIIEEILETLFLGEFIDSEDCVDIGEEVLEILPDCEKALYTRGIIYSKVFDTLERQQFSTEIPERKLPVLRRKETASKKVDIYFSMLRLMWSERFPQLDPCDLVVRKDFLLVNTNP